ncbi:MAG: copper chaperone PCu(A)C [Pseudooceanicola sp.]|nr:copper chaperone PCu(A)C [Pseudooceanicola sp.]
MSLIRSLALAALLGLSLAPLPASSESIATSHPVHLGPLVLSGGFSRATLPNAPVGGGFLTIENTGSEDDRLVSAVSPVAGRVEVHEMAMENDVMKMRALPDGLPIPAGETVTLKPGGFHIMFFDLKQSFKEGDTIMVTLTFARAGSVDVSLLVGAPNARSAGMDHKKMH